MTESDLKALDDLLSELVIEVVRRKLPKTHLHNINDLRSKTLVAIRKARKP